jgi:penicillin-insensitive murein endopeptidase
MKLILFILILVLFSCSPKRIKGSGNSVSKGSVKQGSLENGRRFPKKGDNYKYFSKVTYFINGRAWVHSKVCSSVLEAYDACKQSMPNRNFMIMECSLKKGGKMLPHRTHQNGTSIDFAVPLKKNNKPYHGDQWKGIWHYGMRFNENGECKGNKKVSIDFEDMAKHILELEKAARKRKMYIKKVLLKINLKDEFFKTPSGVKVKKKKIYFAKYLPPFIDNVHDDHYHIDFGFIK